MFCKPNVGWVGGTLMLCSTLLSIATAASGAQNTLTPVETFTASAFAQINAKATPALDKKIDLVFPLIFKKKAQLDALIQAQQDPISPEYHHFLTPEQIGQRFGADEADLRAIVRYAQSQGFTVTNVWPNRLFVSATTTVEQAEKAFHIHLQGYNRPKEMLQDGDPTTFFAPDRQVTLPADIAARITGIHGLSDFLLAHPAWHGFHGKRPGGRLQTPASAQQPGADRQEAGTLHNPTPNFSSSLTPAQVSKVYNLDGLHTLGLNGQGMKIAVISPTQFYITDVQTFATKYGITGYTLNEKWVAADGRASGFNGADEAGLDCEIIIGQANKATVTLYETAWDTDAHFIDSWNQIATDGAPVVSCSWGAAESALSSDTSLVKSLDTALAAMAAAGQSIFSASGDSGANNGPGGSVGIIAPASDPNLTAVGGTQDLKDNSGAWASEQGWSGSGGGLSVLYPQPTWQTGPGVKNSYSNGKRQVPDVAALADDATPGYAIYIHGSQGTGWYNGGGTSASTPLWAAATLLMDENTGHTTKGIGNLAPLLYKLNSSSINPAFHDITTGSNAVTGSNGAYPCTVGWDFVTGWGSADFTKLYNALNAKPAAPTITSFLPTRGPVGTVVTLTGTHFSGATAIKFNGTAAIVFSVVSDTSLTATVPLGATTGKISVTTPGGTASSSTKFTVTIPPRPTITGFTPTSGPVGTVVTIAGTNFTGASAVKFNTTAATVFSVVSATSISATVPTGARTGTISVTTTGGTATSTAKFTVTIPAKPTIISFTPTSGPITTVVTITGIHFTGATAVKFNTTAATTFSVVSDTSIKATVPTGATTGKISVTTPGGTATSTAKFTVTVPAPPTITSFTPTSGPIGTVVTITGTNFTGASAVKFNGTAAIVFSVVSATSITATVPTGATTGPISVTTPGGTATSTAKFTVTVNSGSSISGNVFNDQNGNGVQDSGDGPLTGWTVFIDLNGNGKLDGGEPTATTDGSGNYSFTGLKAGTYDLEVVPMTGWHESLPNVRYGGYQVTLASGKNINNLQFGWTQSCSILGFVYNDQNASGQYVQGEPLLSGWTIFIDLNGSGQPYGTNPTTTTDSGGIYEFDGLAIGTYDVFIVLQDGWTLTQPGNGYTGYAVPLTTSGQVSYWWQFGVL